MVPSEVSKERDKENQASDSKKRIDEEHTKPPLPSAAFSAPSATNTNNHSFGDVLRAFVPFLKMYTGYINSFDMANKRIADLERSSKKFAQFLYQCHQRPECNKLDLVSFLIMVSQIYFSVLCGCCSLKRTANILDTSLFSAFLAMSFC